MLHLPKKLSGTVLMVSWKNFKLKKLKLNQKPFTVWETRQLKTQFNHKDHVIKFTQPHKTTCIFLLFAWGLVKPRCHFEVLPHSDLSIVSSGSLDPTIQQIIYNTIQLPIITNQWVYAYN